jgi:hypothetical protein
VKEYDIFVPLNYNDGSPIETKKIRHIQQILLERFKGLTDLSEPSEGYWKMADVTHKDEIVIYRVLAAKTAAARKFLKSFKEQLKKDLKQEEILIIERDVRAL